MTAYEKRFLARSTASGVDALALVIGDKERLRSAGLASLQPVG